MSGAPGDAMAGDGLDNGNNDISPLLRATTNPWGIGNGEDKDFALGTTLGTSNDDERDVSMISGQSSTASAWLGG
eukprot:CAMPEP_0182580404 /NCGR_PEP_ID=MMETSP1324-20130603/46951_1 /TAXON_ID=236786 /ORGANISM="Florenciella sp., Strain RCC1587" /LENGTH=74 /DNA_ID=CAMNT_0024796629 /DNA_START=25 /DNA_END=245 /DNA_ORIENTATION=+